MVLAARALSSGRPLTLLERPTPLEAGMSASPPSGVLLFAWPSPYRSKPPSCVGRTLLSAAFEVDFFLGGTLKTCSQLTHELGFKSKSKRRTRVSAPHKPLQRVHECDQVGFLVVGQQHIEALVVEVDHVQQGWGRAIVEVGRACRQPTHARDFELTQVSAFARDHRPSRIGGYKLRAVVA